MYTFTDEIMGLQQINVSSPTKACVLAAATRNTDPYPSATLTGAAT